MVRSASETPWSPWDPTGSPRETLGIRRSDQATTAAPGDTPSPSWWEELVFGREKAKQRTAERVGVDVDRVEGNQTWQDTRDWLNPFKWDDRVPRPGIGPFADNSSGGGNTPNLVENPGAVDGTIDQTGWIEPDPFADIARIGREFADAAGQVDANYQSRLNELRDMYALAETPEEKAQLQFMLGNIEAQREAGHHVIRNAYQQAIGQSKQTAGQMRGQAAQDADTFHDLFTGAAGDVRQGIADTAANYEDSGLGVGAVPVSGDAGDFAHVLEAAAPREAALAQQLGNIAADDVAFLGQALSGEQTAQQGQLERLAMQLAAQTQAQHQAQVNQRIGQDRRALAGQAFQMGNRYEDRRWDMEDTARQLELDLAEQRRQAEGEGSIVPEDPLERDIFVQNLLAEYGAAIVPTLKEHGLVPSDYEYDPTAGLE